jgi:hypothetical protein
MHATRWPRRCLRPRDGRNFNLPGRLKPTGSQADPRQFTFFRWPDVPRTPVTSILALLAIVAFVPRTFVPRSRSGAAEMVLGRKFVRSAHEPVTCRAVNRRAIGATAVELHAPFTLLVRASHTPISCTWSNRTPSIPCSLPGGSSQACCNAGKRWPPQHCFQQQVAKPRQAPAQLR